MERWSNIFIVFLGVISVFVLRCEGHLGSCDDHLPSCSLWARRGLCEGNELFMVHNCPKSCDLCLDPTCSDRDRRCSIWAQWGKCSVIPNLGKLCPHSCNICKLPVFKTIAEPDFDCGGSSKNRETPLVRMGEAQMMLGGTMMTDDNVKISVNDTFCGATPISDRYLLTAAHCVLDSGHIVRTVRLGELDFGSNNEANSQPVNYDVEEIIVHPDYDNDSFSRYNDIALIKTVNTIQFSDLVFPFCIPKTPPKHGSKVIGAGFGNVNATSRATHLQEVELNIIGPAECEKIYEEEDSLAGLRQVYPQLLQGKGVLCAAFPGRDACEGDSGGPLFMEDSQGRRSLVGIVSAGISCGEDGVSVLPGTYISVVDQIGFIDSVLYP